MTKTLDPKEVANAKDAEIVKESGQTQPPIKLKEPPFDSRVKPPLKEGEEDDPREVAADQVAENQPAPPPAPDKPVTKQIPIPESEYALLAQSINGLAEMKSLLHTNPNPELQAQVNLMEASIWDTVVKRFGLPSMEVAQQQGLSFGLRTVRVIECKSRQ